MSKFFNDILTGKDGESYDVGRVLWVIGVLVFLGLSIFTVIQGQAWHPLDFGTGLGGILAGGGISIGVKSGTEPDPKE
jgi:hypothetical protein